MLGKLIRTGLSLAVLLGVLLYAGAWLFASWRLAEAYAALRSEGRPLSLEQALPPPVAEPDNAAVLYEKAAFRLLAESSGGQDLLSALGEQLEHLASLRNSPTRLAELRELMSRRVVREATHDLAEGAARAACRFAVEYDKGAEAPLDHLRRVRGLVRMLRVLAEMRALDGDGEGVWTTLLIALRVADSTRSEPLLLSQLARAANLLLILDVLPDLVRAFPPLPETRARAASLLDQLEAGPELWSRTLDGERLVWGEWAFREAGTRSIAGQSIVPPSLKWALLPLLQADHAVYLDRMREAAGRPGFEAARFEALPWYCLLTRMLLPDLARSRDAFAQLQARLEAARAALRAT